MLQQRRQRLSSSETEIRELFQSVQCTQTQGRPCAALSLESRAVCAADDSKTAHLDLKSLFPISSEQCHSYWRPWAAGGHLTPAGRPDMTWAWSRLSAQRLSVCPTCQIHFLRSDLELLQYGTVTGEERAPRFSQVIWSLPSSLLALLQAALRRRAVIKSLISIELDCSSLFHLALSRLHDKQNHKSPLRTTLLSVCDICILDRHKRL